MRVGSIFSSGYLDYSTHTVESFVDVDKLVQDIIILDGSSCKRGIDENLFEELEYELGYKYNETISHSDKHTFIVLHKESSLYDFYDKTNLGDVVCNLFNRNLLKCDIGVCDVDMFMYYMDIIKQNGIWRVEGAP